MLLMLEILDNVFDYGPCRLVLRCMLSVICLLEGLHLPQGHLLPLVPGLVQHLALSPQCVPPQGRILWEPQQVQDTNFQKHQTPQLGFAQRLSWWCSQLC